MIGPPTGSGEPTACVDTSRSNEWWSVRPRFVPAGPGGDDNGGWFIALSDSGTIGPIFAIDDVGPPSWLLAARESLERSVGRPWLVGGQPISQAAATTAVGVLSDVAEAGSREPQVLPLSDGGISIEWHSSSLDIEIHVLSDGRPVVWSSRPLGEQTLDDAVPLERKHFPAIVSALDARG